MRKPHVTFLGKSVKAAMRIRGGGSALPGLIVERIDKDFIKDTLAQLPSGVVVISGTNGKTTTTKMVVELLESQGMKVFTNRTGSNFTRGVAAALVGEINFRGKLNADIAVLELDEAHAVHFVKSVQPRYSLLLNVMRDQLDRFGEIDHTANLLRVTAKATTEKVVINREDPRLARIGQELGKDKAVYFGLSDILRNEFPSDDDMRSSNTLSHDSLNAVATLSELHGHNAKIELNNEKFDINLKLDGIYNIYNSAAAIALVATILSEHLKTNALFSKLETITPAFGRGEILQINGKACELILVKNPSGFRLGLKSFPPNGFATMIAINDNYADGRDMSWLWDVDFNSLKNTGVEMVSGIRAYDMALRLQYDEVELRSVETNIKKALQTFIKQDEPKRIYCTYTAMLAIRRELGRYAKVESIS